MIGYSNCVQSFALVKDTAMNNHEHIRQLAHFLKQQNVLADPNVDLNYFYYKVHLNLWKLKISLKHLMLRAFKELESQINFSIQKSLQNQ